MANAQHMNHKPKPVSPVTIKLGNVPKELKKLNRWILWRYSQLATGKWTKTPHSAKGGFKVDATKTENGVSFMEAAKVLRESNGMFSGLGFILGDGIAGIDVDDCIDSDGNLDERGMRMSRLYADSYAEISPSGQGFKILVNIGSDPKLASIGAQHGGMEIYGGKRYFTITGATLPGHPNVIRSMADAFASTAEELGVDKHKRNETPDGPTDIDDSHSPLGITYSEGLDLLDHLAFKWCDEYLPWLKVGMALHHEFKGSQEALDLWDEWSQRSGRYQPEICSTKWNTFGKPGREFVTMRTLVREAQASGWRAPKTIEKAITDFTVLDSPGVEDWWTKNSAGSFLNSDPEPRVWVWKDILLESKVMVIAGSGGSSKSYLMLAAATQFALGNSWGPFELATEGPSPTRGRALILYGEEDRDDIHHRMHSLKHTFMLTDEQIVTVSENLAVLPLRGQDVTLVEYTPDERDVIVTKAAEKLEERINQYNIRLMVLDPMALLHGLDENDNRAISHFVRAMDTVCMRTKCSVVLVHHFSKAISKAREVNEANVRGASSLVAHSRTVVVMHRLRRDESLEWGVPEDDHARWTMFKVVKNNYGPTDRTTWFNVNQTNGVISPSETQLTFMNSRDIRQAALAAIQEDQQTQEEEITESEERRARIEAERRIQLFRHMELILRNAVDFHGGVMPSGAACRELILSQDSNASARSSRAATDKLRELGLITEDLRRATVTGKGTKWLSDREILS